MDLEQLKEQVRQKVMFMAQEQMDVLCASILAESQAIIDQKAHKGKNSRRQRPRSGTLKGFTVQVVLTDEGPRIAPGTISSPSASRYIKTKDRSEMTPLRVDENGNQVYTYTFKRSGKRHKPNTLRDSGAVVEATVVGKTVRGGVIFRAPYAYYVEKGLGPGKRTPMHFLLGGLEAHRDEIQTGKFLKSGK
jgi:hypothetical protein